MSTYIYVLHMCQLFRDHIRVLRDTGNTTNIFQRKPDFMLECELADSLKGLLIIIGHILAEIPYYGPAQRVGNLLVFQKFDDEVRHKSRSYEF